MADLEFLEILLHPHSCLFSHEGRTGRYIRCRGNDSQECMDRWLHKLSF
jgi:hypothetical protein